jgi:RNA polymerase sigma-70 factor (ECF subfamily)
VEDVPAVRSGAGGTLRAGLGAGRGGGPETGWELDLHGPVGRAQVVSAQAGDSVAFAALYRDLQPRLLRYAAVLVGQDAEDVTAEAWLQIVRDLGRFHGDLDGFRGWCATIVRHRAMDHVRARDRRPVTPMGDTSVLECPAGEDTAGTALEGLSTAAAMALVAGLPRDQAQAVGSLTRFSGHGGCGDHAAVAACL